MNNNRANKTYQSRLIRWVDKFPPFDFTVSHLSGEYMGLTDYLSRNPSGKAEPESNYDEKFVFASISNFFSACKSISQINKPSKAGDKRKRKLPCGCIDKQEITEIIKSNWQDAITSSRQPANTQFRPIRKEQCSKSRYNAKKNCHSNFNDVELSRTLLNRNFNSFDSNFIPLNRDFNSFDSNFTFPNRNLIVSIPILKT